MTEPQSMSRADVLAELADVAHCRARLAALEAVAAAARTVQVQTELGYVPASVITQSWGELDAALAALDALTEVNTDD